MRPWLHAGLLVAFMLLAIAAALPILVLQGICSAVREWLQLFPQLVRNAKLEWGLYRE